MLVGVVGVVGGFSVVGRCGRFSVVGWCGRCGRWVQCCWLVR